MYKKQRSQQRFGLLCRVFLLFTVSRLSFSGSGSYAYEPGGNYYSSPSGAQLGYLRGPSSADFDLKLWKYGAYGWETVASSTSPSSSEDISYSGSSGYYVWRIESYSGSGTYDFYLNRP